ncbi:MAG: hypothetical protein NVS3B26_28080 [Mycobacteriales bacterium]
MADNAAVIPRTDPVGHCPGDGDTGRRYSLDKREGTVTNILVGELPDSVVAALEARGTGLAVHAARNFAQEATNHVGTVSEDALIAFATTFADVAKPEAMRGARGAWGPSPGAAAWAERIENGLVRIATVTRLAVGPDASG